jgi:hypothetical protein
MVRQQIAQKIGKIFQTKMFLFVEKQHSFLNDHVMRLQTSFVSARL